MNSSTGHASVDDLPDPALPGAPAGPLPRFSARTRRAPGVAGGAVLLVPSPSPRLARARRALAAALLLVLATALAGCSVQKLASKSVADSLTKGPDVFGTDNDPELVRDALPFGLKTMEMLLHNLPNHEGLLVTLCKGFTQYSYAFVQTDGDLLVNSDYARSTALHERAFHLYLRARDYGLRALALRHPGIADSLRLSPARAAAKLDAKDLAALYWCAASWAPRSRWGKTGPRCSPTCPRSASS